MGTAHSNLSFQEKILPVLVRTSGPMTGVRYLVRGRVTKVGRHPGNDVVIDGPDAAGVSAFHLEIRLEGNGFHVHDLNSTNGTYVNGERVWDTEISAPCSIQLGRDGPELAFVQDKAPSLDLDQTIVVPASPPAAEPDDAANKTPPPASAHDDLLLDAVSRARSARRAGLSNQTVVIMREMLHKAVRRSSRKFKIAIVSLAVALAGTGAFTAVKLHGLKQSKALLDQRIQELETRLAQTPAESPEAARMIASLEQYQSQGRAMEQSALYRFGLRPHEDYVTHAIRELLAEFGAEVYSVPPEFRQEVNRFLRLYQGPDRPNMEKALNASRPVLDRMRGIFKEKNLPPDLAYMVLVESAFDNHGSSSAGSAGYWQFTPGTARSLGLKVGGGVDERINYRKATFAATKYVRDLILDFGAGSSVMLAPAAYNVGPSKVKSAIRRVADPIKQRNFWYLYRIRALPEETREYVPKVFAAMIIGRDPKRYGF